MKEEKKEKSYCFHKNMGFSELKEKHFYKTKY